MRIIDADYVGAERLKARQRGYEEGYYNGMKIGKTLNPKIKQGEWIKVTDCYCWHWECENCHRRPLRTSTGHDDLSNFCPNCGADMRKD